MLGQLLGALDVVLFRVGNDQVTAAELFGFVTGAASVWLAVLARISNFPVGIANSGFFLVLFLSARLYADSGLQVVYIAPFWDALTTAISLAAQFLLNAFRIENWAFWIAADLIYVPLYAVKRLDLTALVYVFFLGLCAVGVSGWRKALRAGYETPVAAAAVTVGDA